MTTGRTKLPVWIVPLAIAALVGAFGWWGNMRLRHTVESQLRSELTTTLNANVTALEIWLTNQLRQATFLADEPRVQTLATAILEKTERANLDSGPPGDQIEIAQLNNYLRSRLSRINYDAAQLVDELNSTNFVVAAMVMAGEQRGGPRGGPRAGGPPMPVSEAHFAKYEELFTSGQPVIITPYKPEAPPPPPGRYGRRNRQPPFGGEFTNRAGFRGRGTNEFGRGGRGGPPDVSRGRRGELNLMQVAAPVRDTNNLVRGALALIIDPDKEFTRILSVARSGESGETYTFDQHGLLISRSRFEDELRKKGLLAATNTTSALNIRLHDPEGELTDGVRALTYIVANAVAGEDAVGVDVEPTRDYRGVDVVGAWKWLPEYGFGVATQIDSTEAYRPLRVLTLIFIMLILLLVLCATGMFVFSYASLASRRRLTEAQLKLKQLGQYSLEEKIGEGGMGVVYRARHALLRRDTAVKLLLPDRADDVSVARFEREVRLTCQLTHPNTIQVFDYGHTPDGIFYYAMEFLRGLNLHELIARYGPQPEGRVIHILAQVCDSLSEAHALGLVHRDIKPSNVFLCDRAGMPDCVKVLDFGLVREHGQSQAPQAAAVEEKELEGTPWFMPPEAIKDSNHSDIRSDIYSLGALGYYLLTGNFVFDGESIREVCDKHLKEAPTPPSKRTINPVSAELEATILQCLEKEMDGRPQTAMALRELLVKSPYAAQWSLEERHKWWAAYHSQAAPKPGETEHPKVEPTDVEVEIDLADRT